MSVEDKAKAVGGNSSSFYLAGPVMQTQNFKCIL